MLKKRTGEIIITLSILNIINEIFTFFLHTKSSYQCVFYMYSTC